MAQASIPVDALNPGQVFACLGFVEAAEILLGDAEGGMELGTLPHGRFALRADGERNPFEVVLEFLENATVHSIACAGSANSTEKWQVPTQQLEEDEPFPFPDPGSPATLPAVLRGADNRKIVIDHWGDTRRDNVKFWAGSGGYPGAALLRDALDIARPLFQTASADPFSVQAVQSSSFRLDWRRDYIPIDAGFSPNDHGDIAMMGYPLVEVLAAIGLTNARPKRLQKLEYRYGVIDGGAEHPFLSPLFMRAALGCTTLPFSMRTFRMRLGWPGQENQARCITDVSEEVST
jgi:CRISPR-associated protein Csb3